MSYICFSLVSHFEHALILLVDLARLPPFLGSCFIPDLLTFLHRASGSGRFDFLGRAGRCDGNERLA